ncbi:MAG TPA: UDP-N-acetylmuramoyl-tripeptide--D-alanyl-D-alanine ligase [Thiolinea sp.]|nr:UDP-N-acetylmuramoyl-tripeptide--D-alanyl-D-alanine ligase [Thiolinea sp.]
MSWLDLCELARMAGGRLHGIGEDEAARLAVQRVVRDSRQVAAGDLFLALRGERFDGHDFVAGVAGTVSAAMVERVLPLTLPQVVVGDVRLAMGRLAGAWRQRYTGPVVALTGSSGKTTLKEMMAAILSVQGPTHATRGNLNNDLGVPLTLFELRPEQAFAVIEMGANHFGEIDYLTRMVCPDVAVLNNAGAAHLEGFGDLAGVARAKGEIFNGLGPDGVAVINADDAYADYWRGLNAGRRVISFGMREPADVQGHLTPENTLNIRFAGQEVVVRPPLLGQHNALNAVAATAAVMALGVDLARVPQGLETLHPVKGRLCPLAGREGATIIDDTYNANPSSTMAALRALAALQGRRVFVLGDMGELGDNGAALHAEVGRGARALGIEAFFGVGVLSQAACRAFGAQAVFCPDMETLLATLVGQRFSAGTSVLVKGSRAARMERVVRALTEEVPAC